MLEVREVILVVTAPGDVGRRQLGASLIVLVGLAAALLVVVLGSARGSPQGEVFVMDADGTEVTRLTDSGVGPCCLYWPHGSTAWQPVAAPAPELIAFTRSDGIYVMRPDGTGVRPLRRGPVASQAFALDWSHDGSRLAFEAGGAIWVMAADGKGLTRLVAPGAVQGQAHSPTWSPDGRRIAFSLGRKNHSTDKDIWIVNADGGNLRRLMRLPGLGLDNGGFARDAHERGQHPLAGIRVDSLDWSPDGRRIALTAFRVWNPAFVYVVNANGTNLRRLTGVDPHWAPDGRRIAFEQQGDIYVVALDDGSRVRLTRNGEAEPNYSAVWSSDGRRIAFVRFDEHRVLDFLPL